MSTTNELKAFAAYIRREANKNLAAHFDSVEHVFLTVQVDKYTAQIIRPHSVAELQTALHQHTGFLKTCEFDKQKKATQKLCDTLKQWIKKGYAPKYHRYRMARFRLKDAIDTTSNYEVTCLATVGHALELAKKLDKNAGKTFASPASKGYQTIGLPSTRNAALKDLIRDNDIGNAYVAHLANDKPLYVWAFRYRNQQYSDITLAEYVEDYPHDDRFVVLRHGKLYRVCSKVFAIFIGDGGTSAKEAIETAKQKIARVGGTETVDRVLSQHATHSQDSQHSAVLQGWCEQEGFCVEPETGTLYTMAEFIALPREERVHILSTSIITAWAS